MENRANQQAVRIAEIVGVVIALGVTTIIWIPSVVTKLIPNNNENALIVSETTIINMLATIEVLITRNFIIRNYTK